MTEAAGGNTTLIKAQLWWGPANRNPQYESGWTFRDATWNSQQGNNDEWWSTVNTPAVGTYKLVWRFTRDLTSGTPSWTYCDDQGGAGANGGLWFDLENLYTMTTN
jgi:hypothetical protein